MSEFDFNLEFIRYDIKKPDTMLFIGWFQDDNPQNHSIHVYMDQKEIPVEFSMREGAEVHRRYIRYHRNIGQEITGSFSVPSETSGTLNITDRNGTAEHTVLTLTAKKRKEMRKKLNGSLDMERVEENRIVLTGWAVSGQEITFHVYEGSREIFCKVKRGCRRDITEQFPELEKDYASGYEVEFEDPGGGRVHFEVRSGEQKQRHMISLNNVRSGRNGLDADSAVKKGTLYLKQFGLKRTFRRVRAKLFRAGNDQNYDEFLKKYQTTPEELERQRAEKFSESPLISVAVPLYQTKEAFLRELITSLRNQTYSNWELCLADGSGAERSLKKTVESAAAGDERIRYCLLESNLGIAGNTNAAIDMALGEYIALADHDDLLAPEALYECVKAICAHPGADVIYSDEDKVDMAGKKYFEPHFKSDFNPDLLRSMNYICHLFVFHRSVMEKAGRMDGRYEGAQDHDFILRCTEAAAQVVHIPKVLYHWRCHRESTAANPASKAYAFENGRKAVQAHLDRVGLPAKAEREEFFGSFRIRYQWEDQPLVSVIIPNKDHVSDLRKCIDSIEGRSVYPNYEFVIVENNSEQEETFRYYKELERCSNVTVLYYKGGFNFSAINNYGAAHAKGEYLLLLNNDTEMIAEDGLKELLDICMRDDVGIVGAQLFYEDNTIQHAGVIIGFGGIAGHAFIGQERGEYGYFSRIQCVQDLSAVTAACMMTKRSIFEQVGGLSEEFRVAFNDIDYCMKVRETGMLVVYNPHAVFYHYESKSRGLENSAEKVERFNSEADLFRERWMDILEHGDPYYNPNLTLDKADFSLKE